MRPELGGTHKTTRLGLAVGQATLIRWVGRLGQAWNQMGAWSTNRFKTLSLLLSTGTVTPPKLAVVMSDMAYLGGVKGNLTPARKPVEPQPASRSNPPPAGRSCAAQAIAEGRSKPRVPVGAGHGRLRYRPTTGTGFHPKRQPVHVGVGRVSVVTEAR